MSKTAGVILGGLAGFTLQAWSYIEREGAPVDYAGMAGSGTAGALIGAAGGVLVAALLRFLRR